MTDMIDLFDQTYSVVPGDTVTVKMDDETLFSHFHTKAEKLRIHLQVGETDDKE